MIMIDVLNKLAKGEIKAQTDLLVYDHIECIDSYTFDGTAFYDEYDKEIGTNFNIDGKFLNYIVELIPPKEKKYLVKFKLLRSSKEGSFLSWEKCPYGVFLSIQEGTGDIKTHFTKSELQSIQPVREFLEDMEGRYELIEVEDNEID
ncbi:hypothetical protein CIRMBP1257_00501 [Enterococcus cecorum]|nr:hypothetical protein CIRMBP1257_00501 [Enterococcus cecorum]